MKNKETMTAEEALKEIADEKAESVKNMNEEKDVRVLCEEAAEKILKELNSGKYLPGTKEYDALIKALAEIGKIRNEEFKNEADQYDKEQRFEEEKKHWKVDMILRIAQILASVGLTLVGFIGTFAFEKEHVITTKVFNWVQKLIPRLGK